MAGQLIPTSMQTTKGGVLDENGQYHADPMWQRYQQEPADILGALRSLMPKPKPDMSPIPMPKPPAPPPGFGAVPVGEPNIKDDSTMMDTSNLSDGVHGVPGNRMNVTGGMDNLDSVLEGLRDASGIERGNYSTEGELYRLQKNRLDEMRTNLALEQKYPSTVGSKNWLGQPSGTSIGGKATPQDFADLQKDVEQNPVAQREQQRLAEQKMIDAARMGGWGTPQAQAQAQFGLEKSKVESPLEVAKVQGQTLRDVERLKEANAQTQLENFRSLISSGAWQPGMTIRSGGNSISQTQPNLTGYGQQVKDLDTLIKERDALVNGRSTLDPISNMFGLSRQQKIDQKNKAIADAQAALAGRGGGGIRTATPGAAAFTTAGQIPASVTRALASEGPGKHTFSDGSVYMKDTSGQITKVQ